MRAFAYSSPCPPSLEKSDSLELRPELKKCHCSSSRHGHPPVVLEMPTGTPRSASGLFLPCQPSASGNDIIKNEHQSLHIKCEPGRVWAHYLMEPSNQSSQEVGTVIISVLRTTALRLREVRGFLKPHSYWELNPALSDPKASVSSVIPASLSFT